MRSIVASEKDTFVDELDALDYLNIIVRVVCHHDVTIVRWARQIGTFVDKDDLPISKPWFHRGPADTNSFAESECPAKELEGTSGWERSTQLAVTQASSRPLEAQKMLWISSIAAISFSATSTLAWTLASEHNLAAFQNVV